MSDDYGINNDYDTNDDYDIDNDRDLHWIIVVLEFARQFFLMRLGANDFFPILRVIVATRHDYANFFFPVRTQL